MNTKTEKSKERYSKAADNAVSFARFFATIFLIAFIIMLYIVNFNNQVSGTSMYPTLEDGQRLIVWRLNYTPTQGDIVITDVSDKLDVSETIVKRVIATEGQTVDIDYDTNTVYVDGVALEEDYLNDNDGDPDYDVMEETTEMVYNHITVPEGCVFVMGDNRNHSRDSRYEVYGCLEVDDIIGKVIYAD